MSIPMVANNTYPMVQYQEIYCEGAMTEIENNKELLCKAINNYHIYTKCQRKILSALVDLSVQGIVTTTVSSLVKVSGVASTIIYDVLNDLEGDNAIAKIGITKAPVKAFELNPPRLNFIVKSYLKKTRIPS